MANINKVISLKKNAEQTVFVGDKEDLIPFAWRAPLLMPERKKVSRVFKTMQQAETERAMMVPAHTDE